jgi:hypothetical protein
MGWTNRRSVERRSETDADVSGTELVIATVMAFTIMTIET